MFSKMKRFALKMLSGITLLGILIVYKSGKLTITTNHRHEQESRDLRDMHAEQDENQLTIPYMISTSIYREIDISDTDKDQIYGTKIATIESYMDLQTENQTPTTMNTGLHTDLNSEVSELNVRQKERQSVLRNSCQRLNISKSNENNPTALLDGVKLLYSDKYRLIVCEIPKCGCSSIKKMFLVAEGFVNETNPQKIDPAIVHPLGDAKLDLRKLKDKDKILNRLNSYYKLIIVRDPIYRLLSAYRNKLEIYYPWSKYFAKISQNIHAKYSNDSKLASFSEFLSYVSESKGPMDQHWEMYHKLCNPCSISYDFIAHIETVGDDMNYVMEKAKMADLSLPQNYDKSKTTDQDKFAKYIDSVPKSVIRNVYEKYKTDYELFGFASP